jgi:formate/nitrite transporter FocA (FNT family)
MLDLALQRYALLALLAAALFGISTALKIPFDTAVANVTEALKKEGFGVNFGVGRGLTNASDHWVVKTIISIPLKW